MTAQRRARLLAELVGTAFLLVAVVGSGIMATRLSDDVGVQLLANAVATGGALFALITTFGSVSGAHFNPAVSLMAWRRGDLPAGELGGFIGAQVVGGIGGTVLANVIFELDPIEWSERSRVSAAALTSEVVATFGLLIVIAGTAAAGKLHHVAAAVAVWITGAYWFTSSTSFANPAVTIARTFSNTFAGIEPADAAPFVLAQLGGLAAALVLVPMIVDVTRD